MSAAFAVVATLLTLVIGAIPIYFLAKSNARENRRQRNEEISTAVSMTTGPLLAENGRKDAVIAAKDVVIANHQQTIRDRDRRIEELEDQLRQGRR